MADFSNAYSNISSQYLQDGDMMDDSDSSSAHDDAYSDDGNNGQSSSHTQHQQYGTSSSLLHNNSSSHHSSKKSRISQACDSCRRRKRRCDGIKPACTPCSKLSMDCIYPVITKKRGPEAGVVKRLRNEVKQLENELKQEQLALQQQQSTGSASSFNLSNLSNTTSDAVYNGVSSTGGSDGVMNSVIQPLTTTVMSLQLNIKFSQYIKQYFTCVNNTIFPYLNQRQFTAECDKYKQLQDTPVSFNLRLGAVLAIGQYISDEQATQYFHDCVQFSRTSTAEVFDIPNIEVIRGLLLLVSAYTAMNDAHKSACILAICNRLIEIIRANDKSFNDSNEIVQLYHFNEHALTASTWLPTVNFAAYASSTALHSQQNDRFSNHRTLYDRVNSHYRQSVDRYNNVKSEPAPFDECKNAGVDVADTLNKVKLLQLLNELLASKLVISDANVSIYKTLAQLTVYEHCSDINYLQLIMVLFCKLVYVLNLNDTTDATAYFVDSNKLGISDTVLQYITASSNGSMSQVQYLITCIIALAMQYDVSSNSVYGLIYYFVACIQLDRRVSTSLINVTLYTMQRFSNKYTYCQPLHTNLQQKCKQYNVSVNSTTPFTMPLTSAADSVTHLQQQQQVYHDGADGYVSQQDMQPTQLMPQSSIDYASNLLLPNSAYGIQQQQQASAQPSNYTTSNAMFNFALPPSQPSSQQSNLSNTDYNALLQQHNSLLMQQPGQQQQQQPYDAHAVSQMVQRYSSGLSSNGQMQQQRTG